MVRLAWWVVSLMLLVSSAVNAESFTYPLFDGESLNGWTVENDAQVEVTADGTLKFLSGNGWLRTHHQFQDFRLQLEWRTLKPTKYDAGIFFRAANQGKPFPKPAYQVNLLEGQEGTLIGVQGGKCEGMAKPAGEWNAFDLTVRGDRAKLVVNGKTAYDLTGVDVRPGFLGLQIEVPLGGQFEFRNIDVTEYGSKTLFDGKSLAGWEGASAPAESCWSVKNGQIVCSGIKGGTWLRSAERFGDFNLRFDYQLESGGNSGIYVRVPENGLHHRDDESQPEAGFEVQVLEDSAAKYRKLKPYQYCASVYDIEGADPRVSHPPGEWNTLEIDCRGQEVTTIHNGEVVVHINSETHPLLALRQVEGYLGLQNHSSVVRFRNLRIGPARENLIPPSKQVHQE
ncbi:MAG: DUF1080 domain-containing protein [Planctomycetaceae bacterium]|nr:DUF1080 domain-containing protein [Planctomycetaceae bacterium]